MSIFCPNPNDKEYQRLVNLPDLGTPETKGKKLNTLLVEQVITALEGKTDHILTHADFIQAYKNIRNKKLSKMESKASLVTKSTISDRKREANKRPLSEFTPQEIQELEASIIYIAAWDMKDKRIKDIEDITFSDLRKKLEALRNSAPESLKKTYDIVLKEDNLQELVERAVSTLRSFNITIDPENSADDKIDDANGNVHFAEYNEVSTLDKARHNAKLQVFLLPSPDPGKLLGLNQFVDFKNTWNDLESLFSDVVPTAEEPDVFKKYIQILTEQGSIKKEYITLRNKLLNSSKQLQTQFVLALNNYKSDYYSHSITPVLDGSKGYFIKNFSSKSNNMAKSLTKVWQSNFLDNILEYDNKGGFVLKDKARATKILNQYNKLIEQSNASLAANETEVDTEFFNSVIDLLSVIGIHLDSKALEAYIGKNSVEGLNRLLSNSGIGYVFNKSDYNSNSLEQLIAEGPIQDQFSDIVTPLTDEKGVEELAGIQARFEISLTDNVTYGPGGKMYQNMTEFDFITKTITQLHSDSTFIDGEPSHYETNSLVRQYLKENPEARKNLNVLSFLSRKLEGGDAGLDINEISFVDEFSMLIDNVMNDVMPYLTLADKKRFYFIKGMPVLFNEQKEDGTITPRTSNITKDIIPQGVKNQFLGYVYDELLAMQKAWDEVYGENPLALEDMVLNYHYKLDKEGNPDFTKGNAFNLSFLPELSFSNKDENEIVKSLYDDTGRPLDIATSREVELPDGSISFVPGHAEIIWDTLGEKLQNKISDTTQSIIDTLMNIVPAETKESKKVLSKIKYLQGAMDKLRTKEVLTDEEKLQYANDEANLRKLKKELAEVQTYKIEHTSLSSPVYEKYIAPVLKDGVGKKEDIEKAVKIIALNYTLKRMAANIEYTKLFTGDPRMYKNLEDFAKRTPAGSATGKYGHITDEIPEFFNVAVANDNIISSEYLKTPKKGEDDPFYEHITRGITDKKELARLKTLLDITRDSYANVDQTDAQGWITMKRFRDILKMVGEWNYNGSMDDAYNRITNPNKYGKPTKEDYELFQKALTTMQPRKGMHYEVTNRAGKKVPVYLKYSQAILFPELLASSRHLTNIAEQMDMQGVDELVVTSGVKVGAVFPTNMDNFNNPNATPEELTFNTIQLRNDHWKLQNELPTKWDKETLVGSQIKKNILADINPDLDYEGMNGDELIKAIHNMETELSNRGVRKVINKLGINEQGQITDHKKLYKFLIDELKKEGGSRMVIKALENDMPLDFILSHRTKLLSKVVSHINKKTVKLKQHGGAAIQMSNYGFEKFNGDITYNDLKDKDKNGIVWLTDDRTLKPVRVEYLKDEKGNFVTDEDGKRVTKTFSGEVLLPYNKIAKLFGNQWNEIKKLPAAEIMKRIDPAALDLIGYRIPNQKLASSGSLKVVGILPPHAGDTIIMYSEITKQTGSDFDIDKLYYFFPSIKKEEDIYGNINIKKVIYNEDPNDYIGRAAEMVDDPESLETVLDIIYTKEDKEVASKYIKEVTDGLAKLQEESNLRRSGKAPILVSDYYIDEEGNHVPIIEEVSPEVINGLKDDIKELKEAIKKAPKAEKLELQYDLFSKQYALSNYFLETPIALSKLQIKKEITEKLAELFKTQELSIAEQNSERAFQSRRVDLYKKVLESPHSAIRAISTVDSDWLKNHINITSPKETLDGFTFYSGDYQMQMRREFIASKGGVGQMANNQSDHAISQGSKKYITDSSFRLSPTGELSLGNTFSTKFENIVVENGKFVVESIDEHYYITEVISAYMNAFVDAAKDNYIGRANFNNMTNNAAMLLIRSGLSPQFANALLSQPYIQKYVKLTQVREGQAVSSRSIKPEAQILEELGFDAINTEIGLYDSNQNFRKEFETVNLMKYIKQFKEDPNSIDKEIQHELFSIFLYAQSLGKKLNLSMKASNMDVKGAGTTVTEAFMQKNIRNNALTDTNDENITSIGNMEEVYEKTSADGTKYTTLTGAAYKNSVEVVIDAISPQTLEGSPFMQEVVTDLFWTIYGKYPDDPGIAKKLFQLSFATILGQNIPVLQKSSEEIAAMMKGNNSLAKRLIKLRKDYKYRKNSLIQYLVPELGTYSLDYITISNIGRNEKIDEHLMEDWAILFKSKDPVAKQFATDLITYAFYTSALTDHLSSIYRIIPPNVLASIGLNRELFEDLRTKLNSDSYRVNKNAVIKEVLKNSWYDNKIVPKVYGKKVTSVKYTKDGKVFPSDTDYVFGLKASENSNLIIADSDEFDPVFKPYIVKSVAAQTSEGAPIIIKGKKIVNDILFEYVGNTKETKDGTTSTIGIYRRVGKKGESKGLKKLFELNPENENSVINKNNLGVGVDGYILNMLNGINIQMPGGFRGQKFSTINLDFQEKISNIAEEEDFNTPETLSEEDEDFTSAEDEATPYSVYLNKVKPGAIRYYEGNIKPEPNTIFVFGSNPLGINGNPIKYPNMSASVAVTQFGVKQGEKMNNRLSDSGNAYGLVTVTGPGRKKSLTPQQIVNNIQKLYTTAEENPTKDFKIAYRNGRNNNGYTNLELIEMFNNAGNIPPNIIFSKEWFDTGKLNLDYSSKTEDGADIIPEEVWNEMSPREQQNRLDCLGGFNKLEL